MEISVTLPTLAHTLPADRVYKDQNDLNGCEFKSQAFLRAALSRPLFHVTIYRLDYVSPADHSGLKHLPNE